MNVLEMRLRFDEFLRESSSSFPDRDTFIDSNTILKYLNEAQVEYIQKAYLSAPTFYERTKIIGNSLNDLRNLIKVITLDAEDFNLNYPNTTTFRSSTTDVWHYISITGKLSRLYPYATSDTIIDMFPIEAEDINKHLTTSINAPIILVPVYTQAHSSVAGTGNQLSVLVVYDKYTVFTSDTVTAHCLVKPKKLVFTPTDDTQTNVCEVAEYLHDSIVRLAVSLYDQDKYKLSNKSTK